MRRTVALAALFIGFAATTVSAVEIPDNPVVHSYEQGCSAHKPGTAANLKCRTDGLKEIQRNCETLHTRVLTAKPALVENEKRKQTMWCDAAKKFKVK